MKNEKTEKPTHDSQVSEENLRRLQILDRYKETPRSEEEEEKERKRLINLATSGNNTFIAYEDLETIAKSGKPFLSHPTQKRMLVYLVVMGVCIKVHYQRFVCN
ncbi:hypothetical protein PGH43_09645 [Legionella pneumophila 130b]|nr:hypothetical protein PGH43_09645 [Legionella pneumophila 130b]